MSRLKKKDYSKLTKEELVHELENVLNGKKYGLVWRDKPEDVAEMCKNNFPILEPVNDKDIRNDETGPTNIMIEGDNYHALSVLRYTHTGKIDVIYIDPPYNTGNNDFIYNDKLVDKEDGFRHSAWLSFMEKRLKIAKSLLKSTGAIFISIDNNEQAPLRMLCDEIFDENNFVGTLIWRKKEGGGQADAYFVTEHEYVLVYARSQEFKWLDEEILIEESEFNKEDQSGKFTAVKLAKWGNTARREDRPKMYFSIKSPDGKNVYPIAPDGGDGRWRVGKKRMNMLVEKDLIFWQKKRGKWLSYEKIYFKEGEVKKIKERSILLDVATTTDGTNELTRIFGKKDIFENPKPTELIKFFLRHGAKQDAVVLDFFAGSGTTGHAAMMLNKEDGGQRQFILCTNNENAIAERVCYPRIKKVIEGYEYNGKIVNPIPGNLRYYRRNFVQKNSEDEVTDDDRVRLARHIGEMIALRENTLREKTDETEYYQIFTDGKRHCAIYFREDMRKLPELTKKLAKLEKVALYIFSWTTGQYQDDFAEFPNITVNDIPEPIIEVYKQINAEL